MFLRSSKFDMAASLDMSNLSSGSTNFGKGGLSRFLIEFEMISLSAYGFGTDGMANGNPWSNGGNENFEVGIFSILLCLSSRL